MERSERLPVGAHEMTALVEVHADAAVVLGIAEKGTIAVEHVGEMVDIELAAGIGAEQNPSDLTTVVAALAK